MIIMKIIKGEVTVLQSNQLPKRKKLLIFNGRLNKILIETTK